MSKILFIFTLAALIAIPGISKAATSVKLLVPRNNSVDYNAKVTFLNWQKTLGKSYVVQVRADNGNFVDSDTVTSAVGEESYLLASDLQTANLAEGVLNDGKTYYWRVKTTENGALWSPTFKFSAIGAPAAATGLSPYKEKNGTISVVEENKAKSFSWKNPKGVVYNRVYVATPKVIQPGVEVCVTAGTYIVKEFMVSSNKFSSDWLKGLNDGKYCWVVETFNNGEESTLSSAAFFQYKKNALIANPLFVQTDFNSVILYWTKLPVASAYTLKVSLKQNMEGALIQETENNYIALAEGDIYNLVRNNPGKDIFWQVGVSGSWSKVLKFKSNFLKAPELVSPVSGVSANASNVSFSWKKNTSAKYYELRFMKIGTGSVQAKTYLTSDIKYKPALDAFFVSGENYLWSVRAYGDSQTSSYSQSRTFTQE